MEGKNMIILKMNKSQASLLLQIVFEIKLSWNKSLLLTFHLQNKFDVLPHVRMLAIDATA
jgi:hypothetical protein